MHLLMHKMGTRGFYFVSFSAYLSLCVCVCVYSKVVMSL